MNFLNQTGEIVEKLAGLFDGKSFEFLVVGDT